MRIPPNRFLQQGIPGLGRRGVPGASRAAAPAGSAIAPEASAVKERMRQQSEGHLTFLLRAREGLALYEEKVRELEMFIADHQDWTQADVQDQVKAAAELLPQMKESIEKLQEVIGKEQEEHTFIMSGLEALLDEGGAFPVKTLEAYLEKREEEEPRYPKYTLSDLDRMIEGVKKELGRTGFSVSV